MWMATLLTGGFFNYIHRRSVMFLQDAALDLNKPTLCEAPPQRHHASETTPLLSSAGDQPTVDVSGSPFVRDIVVIWPFVKSLVATLLF
jgi:hypothetical protein